MGRQKMEMVNTILYIFLECNWCCYSFEISTFNWIHQIIVKKVGRHYYQIEFDHI
jgi:hypothetical protein